MANKINSQIERMEGGTLSSCGKSKHRKIVFVDTEPAPIKAFEALRRSIQSLPDDRLDELQASIASEKNRRKRK